MDNLIERLDPELVGPVKMMMSMQSPGMLDDIPAARTNSTKMMEMMKQQAPVIPGVVSEDHRVHGPSGASDITLRVYRPEGNNNILPALYWIHGGGYVLGNIEQDDANCRQMVRAGECVVISVEYRLAPEHPFPAPLEDCYAGLKWVAQHAAEISVDGTHIAIGGGSAGGGLAAGLALLARDRGEVKVTHQFLIYPMIDDHTVAPADAEHRDALFWTRESNLIGWRSYLGGTPGGEGVSPYAAASRATELAGLPPAYIAVGDIDLFAEEDIEYARRLVASGIPTELHVYPGGCHAFDMMNPAADVCCRFNDDFQRALRRAMHGLPDTCK